MNKKEQIKALVIEMLNETNKEMINDIDKIFDSGCVNIDDWCETRNRMIMPKSIITALFEKACRLYSGKGTSFEKEVRKTVNNISRFI